MAKKMTIIVLSDEMDKAYPALILAAGAAAAGIEVTMFYTFWGLNLLKKGGLAKAKLSKMNMLGLGRAMLKKRMAKLNVASLEKLLSDAKELGVKIIACEMTMGVFGVTKESLIPEVDELAGVGAYLADAKEANINLVI